MKIKTKVVRWLVMKVCPDALMTREESAAALRGLQKKNNKLKREIKGHIEDIGAWRERCFKAEHLFERVANALYHHVHGFEKIQEIVTKSSWH